MWISKYFQFKRKYDWWCYCLDQEIFTFNEFHWFSLIIGVRFWNFSMKVLIMDRKSLESIWPTFMETCWTSLITKILWNERIPQESLTLDKYRGTAFVLIFFVKSMTVDIIKCRFGIIDCTAMMKTVKTMYGYCKEGQPSRFIGIELQDLTNPSDFKLLILNS